MPAWIRHDTPATISPLLGGGDEDRLDWVPPWPFHLWPSERDLLKAVKPRTYRDPSHGPISRDAEREARKPRYRRMTRHLQRLAGHGPTTPTTRRQPGHGSYNARAVARLRERSRALVCLT